MKNPDDSPEANFLWIVVGIFATVITVVLLLPGCHHARPRPDHLGDDRKTAQEIAAKRAAHMREQHRSTLPGGGQ